MKKRLIPALLTVSLISMGFSGCGQGESASDRGSHPAQDIVQSVSGENGEINVEEPAQENAQETVISDPAQNEAQGTVCVETKTVGYRLYGYRVCPLCG